MVWLVVVRASSGRPRWQITRQPLDEIYAPMPPPGGQKGRLIAMSCGPMQAHSIRVPEIVLECVFYFGNLDGGCSRADNMLCGSALPAEWGSGCSRSVRVKILQA